MRRKGIFRGFNDSSLQKAVTRFLDYFEAIGEARKNEQGLWEWEESMPKFSSETSFRLISDHSKILVGLGLGGILLPSSESTLSGAGYDESVRTVMSELVGSDERGGIPTANISFMPSDHLDIQAFVFEDPLMGILDDEGGTHLTRKELTKLHKEYGKSVELALFAKQHLASGYPELTSKVQQLESCLTTLNGLLAKVPPHARVYIPSRLGVLRKGSSGLDEIDDRVIMIGFKKGEVPDLKKYEYMNHVRLIPFLSQSVSSFSIPLDDVVKLPDEDQDETEERTPKEYQKMASQLEDSLLERREILEALIKEFSLLRWKVRMGSILRGRCEVCPIEEIRPNSY